MSNRASAAVVIKSIVAGLVAAVISCVLAVFAEVAFVILRLWSIARAGSGGLGAISFGFAETGLYVAPVGFALGFYWQYKRSSRAGGRAK